MIKVSSEISFASSDGDFNSVGAQQEKNLRDQC